MVLGLSLPTFTAVHVLISLVGIVSGLIAMVGLLRSHITRGWTALFLLTTILTSVTGFLFPFTKLLSSHIVGIVSLVCSRSRYSRCMDSTFAPSGGLSMSSPRCYRFI
jgi:hypothetical protein